MCDLLADVLLERTLSKDLAECIGYQGCPSPGNPATRTFPRPPPFTFAGEVAEDSRLVAVLKVIFRQYLTAEGEWQWNVFRDKVPR